jgi:LacI family transcriptional regulator
MGRSHAIGCMVDTISNPLLALVVDSMERHLSAAGYTLLLANSHHSRTKEREILSMFEDRGMDGAIVTTSFVYPAKARNPFASTRLPLVMLDRKIHFSGDAVFIDHRGGALEATRHLIALGHRRIALFTAGSVLRPATERLAGFRQAFREVGLEADEAHISVMGLPSESGFDEMNRILNTNQPPTALICMGTRLLSGALGAIRERGLRVPNDFSVVAIGESNLMDFFPPRMTMLRYDMALMGETAAKLMISRLEGDSELPPRSMELPMPLVVGESSSSVS